MTELSKIGIIREINGPIVTIGLPGIRNGEQVKIGELGLIGEVIALDGENALVQTYESTEGIRPGERVEGLGWPLSVELGPGLLGAIFDGVQRPLEEIFLKAGDHIPRGMNISALDREKSWRFIPSDELEAGSELSAGTKLGAVRETNAIEHRILVPPDRPGELLELAPEGDYRIDQSIGRIRAPDGRVRKLYLYHRWPVRRPRPYLKRDHGVEPLITGQRILDTFFPLLKGGKGAVPGPFGAGKTVQLGSRLEPYGVPIVALDFPGAADGIGRHAPGLEATFGAERAAREWQMPVDRAKAILDELAGRAVLVDIVDNGETTYALPPPMAASRRYHWAYVAWQCILPSSYHHPRQRYMAAAPLRKPLRGYAALSSAVNPCSTSRSRTCATTDAT